MTHQHKHSYAEYSCYNHSPAVDMNTDISGSNFVEKKKKERRKKKHLSRNFLSWLIKRITEY